MNTEGMSKDGMSTSRPVKRVVILGRDESLWLSANALWRAFNRADIELVAVELPSLLRPSDVYPTLKSQEAFHSLLGLEEAPLMAASAGTFSLGQRFSNWSKTRAPFIHGYSTYGMALNRVPFVHYWVKARQAGLKAEFEDFSINAAAAKQGKFFIPGEATDGFAICDYAYHLAAQPYCQALKKVALQRGVQQVSGLLAEVVKDPQDGRILSLRLRNGETIEGDFFIDASGAESLLLGQAMGAQFTSWREWFPCDRMLTIDADRLPQLPAYSQVSAFRSGWVGLYPLRHATAVQQVYASVDMSDADALEAAGLVSSLRLRGDAVVTRLTVGRRAQTWIKNCVAIGEAAAVLDPLDSARMHVNLIGLSHLISLFPVDQAHMIEASEYNRTVGDVLDRMRDFQICHYKLNQRFDQPLWDHCRNMSVPDDLAYKIDLFAARGNLVMYDDETFPEDSWAAILIGHGLIPDTYDPLVDQMPEGETIRSFQKMLGFIKTNVEAMQTMDAFFQSNAAMLKA